MSRHLATAPLTIRVAGPADELAVRQLAELDSATAPEGDVLLAELDGRLAAAASADGETYIGDPFVRSDVLVALLRLQAASIFPRAERAKRGPRQWGWLPGGAARPRPQLGFSW